MEINTRVVSIDISILAFVRLSICNDSVYLILLHTILNAPESVHIINTTHKSCNYLDYSSGFTDYTRFKVVSTRVLYTLWGM